MIRELCRREGPDFFESRSLAGVLEKAGQKVDRGGLLSLVRQIMDAEPFARMGALASGLRDLARDDDEYAKLVSDIASKVRGDLTWGPFKDALVRIGSSRPGTAVRIARRLVKSGDSYCASLLAGGARLGAPREAAALADKLLSSPGDREIAAGIRCLNVSLYEHGVPAAGGVLDRVENALERGGEDAAVAAMELLLDMCDGKNGRAGRMIGDAAKRHTRCRALLAECIWRHDTFDDETSLRHLAACARDWSSRATIEKTHYALAKIAETRPAKVAAIVKGYLASGYYDSELTGHVLQEVGRKVPCAMIRDLLCVVRLRRARHLSFFLPGMIRDVSKHTDRKQVFNELLDSLGGGPPRTMHASQ